MTQTVLITATDDTVKPLEYDRIISVEGIFSDITRSEIVETISRVSSLTVPHTGCIEFDIVWRRMTSSKTSNLVRTILFSQRLKKRLNELNVTQGTLVCGKSLEEPYIQAVEDIAEMTSLEIRQKGRRQSVSTLFAFVSMISVVVKMGPILGDWLFARIVALGMDEVENKFVYFPSIERLNSTLPVIEMLNSKPKTIFMVPSWYYALQSETRASLATYDPSGIHQYLSVSGLLGQIRDIWTISREVLTTRSFTPALTDAVETEFGVRLDLAMSKIVRNTLSDFRLVRALVLRRPFRSVFAAGHVEKVIMGSLDPIGRAIIHEATEYDVQLYHIPHSIGTTRPPNPESNVVQFVSGENDIRYYKQEVPSEQWWHWVPAGRPYLSELAEQYGSGNRNPRAEIAEDDRFKLLLATQPFSSSIRKQFVKTIAASCDPDRIKLTVKAHPDEDPSIYENMRLEHEDIRITTTGLCEEITDSDLTVTVNSNVGLESVIIGTPVVCYNPWEPFILDQTYALADEIPVFRSEAEFQTFVSQFDNETMSQLWRRQQAFAQENYHLEPEVSANIAEYIQRDTSKEEHVFS